MSALTQQIVSKAWNFAHVLRDDGLSYLAWVWDVWGRCSTLIQDYEGTPTAFGAAYRSHLMSPQSFADTPYTSAMPSRPFFEIPPELRHERLWFGVIVGLAALAGTAWFVYRRRRAAP